jgi:hypothetical protein
VSTNGAQAPDSKPGFYYVSVVRGKADYRLLRGPFVNDHAAALAAVDAARFRAYDLDPRAAFYAYGTVRFDEDSGPGILDKLDAAAAARSVN